MLAIGVGAGRPRGGRQERRASCSRLSITALLAGCSASWLPAGFPSSVPVAPWPVLTPDHDEFEWHARIGSEHAVKACTRARSALLHAGFDEIHDEESAGGSDGRLCDASWCAGVTGCTDPEHGPSVRHEVFRTSGMGAPAPITPNP